MPGLLPALAPGMLLPADRNRPRPRVPGSTAPTAPTEVTVLNRPGN